MTDKCYYYNRQGKPITVDEWISEKNKGLDNQRVALTEIGAVRISTVWVGLDCRLGDGPPLIFETMVFGGVFDEAQERYSTEAEALAGHDKWVAEVRASEHAQAVRHE